MQESEPAGEPAPEGHAWHAARLAGVVFLPPPFLPLLCLPNVAGAAALVGGSGKGGRPAPAAQPHTPLPSTVGTYKAPVQSKHRAGVRPFLGVQLRQPGTLVMVGQLLVRTALLLLLDELPPLDLRLLKVAGATEPAAGALAAVAGPTSSASTSSEEIKSRARRRLLLEPARAVEVEEIIVGVGVVGGVDVSEGLRWG